jgi:hypothetical protein
MARDHRTEGLGGFARPGGASWWHDRAVEEVRRRRDDELEGFVAEDDEGWLALTVFHGVLGRAASPQGARRIVHDRGLASLAQRWYWWSRMAPGWRVVVPLEASPGRVRVALGYYSLPGVDSTVITAEDLTAGDRLTLEAPPDAD